MAAPTTCAFPLFRERYLTQIGNAGAASAPACPDAPPGGQEAPPLSPSKAASRMGNLRVLDLRSLPRDDGPPTELRARKEKLAHYERQCSRVAEGLYVGAEYVAKSREALREAGITHVVNCVGFLYPPYFEDELQYQVLYLQDTPGEDILCIMYDVFDFIEAAGGSSRVLIHCSQGVSRSATLAIAYLMWKQSAAYDDVFQAVKEARGVTNPNIGFICQLLQWHKRRTVPLDCCRLYRIAPQSAAAPQYLVAKPVSGPSGSSLDPRGAFVLQSPTSLAVWVGASCPEPFVAAGQRFAAQLQKYEGAAAGSVTLVQQGQEPDAFWSCLAAAAAAGEGSRSGSPAASGSASVVASPAADVAAAEAVPMVVEENSSYDKDFELYQRAVNAHGGGGASGADSARSGGRKTPREDGDAATSPNDRLRKQARGVERPPSPGKRRREPSRAPSDLSLERNVSMDSATAQLGKKERTLQEVSGPGSMEQATSDELPSAPHDGSSTSRSSMDEQEHRQRGWQPRPSNLGRSASSAASDAAVAAAAAAAAPTSSSGSQGGGRRAVPPINLRLALGGQ